MTPELKRYDTVKYLLVSTSVGTTSASLLQGSWVPWGIVSILAVLCIASWLWRARALLSRRYLEREADAAISSSRDKWVWGDKKPRVRDLAIPLFFLSFASLWFAHKAAVGPYKAGSGGPSGRLLDLIYTHAGMQGVVVFWVVAWAVLMTVSAEVVVGSRMKCNT